MTVQDVFAIRGRGVVATGEVQYGELSVGDQVRINDGPEVQVDAIETFRKKVKTVGAGDNVGLLLSKLGSDDVAAGDVITGLGAKLDRIVVNSLERRTFHAKLVLRRNGSIFEIDSRPSDAVAVAVRLDAPIFVQEEVLEHVCSSAHNPDNTPSADDPTIV